jgi:hypothetical protein
MIIPIATIKAISPNLWYKNITWSGGLLVSVVAIAVITTASAASRSYRSLDIDEVFRYHQALNDPWWKERAQSTTTYLLPSDNNDFECNDHAIRDHHLINNNNTSSMDRVGKNVGRLLGVVAGSQSVMKVISSRQGPIFQKVRTFTRLLIHHFVCVVSFRTWKKVTTRVITCIHLITDERKMVG